MTGFKKERRHEMAGDWMKFEKATLDKPEVFEIANALKIDPDAVVGKLLRVWNWFDDQSLDGNAPVTVMPLLDRYTAVTGFTKAMQSVGWLVIEDGIMSLPNFERHNGQTAKTRALTAKRVSKSRSKCNDLNVTSDVTPSLPEKRIEENSILSLVSDNGATQLEKEIVNAWNELPDPIRPIRGKIPKASQAAFKARSKDPDFLADWKEAIESIKHDPHCLGQNKTSWVANIGYFLKPDAVGNLLSRKAGRTVKKVNGSSRSAGGHNEGQVYKPLPQNNPQNDPNAPFI